MDVKNGTFCNKKLLQDRGEGGSLISDHILISIK